MSRPSRPTTPELLGVGPASLVAVSPLLSPANRAGSLLPEERLYDTNFAIGFAANLLFMVGQTLSYNYSRYVVELGGNDHAVGVVTGLATAAVLLCRPWIGGWVDRIGVLQLWQLGLVMYAVATAGNLLVSAVGVELLGLRVMWNMGWGLAFVCNTAYPAMMAPPHRRAEAIGAQGVGGFLGTIVGPALTGVLFDPADPNRFQWIFGTAAIAVAVAAGLVCLLRPPPPVGEPSITEPPGTSPSRPAARSSDAPTRWTPVVEMVRWWPGTVTLVGVAMGLLFVLTMSFVARHADHTGLHHYAWFFYLYAPAAMSVRILLRRLPEILGRRNTVLLGLLTAAAGYESFHCVDSAAMYAVPGWLLGFAHGLIFPSMVDLTADAFPARRRGLATSLIIGAQEAGMLAGAPLMGWVVETRGFEELFHVMTVATLAVAGTFLAAGWMARTSQTTGAGEECRSTSSTAAVAMPTSSTS